MAEYKTFEFPRTRLATIDIGEIGSHKHYVTALLEMDVTSSRQKIKAYKKKNGRISFTAWLIKVISLTIKEYEHSASYLKGKRKLVVFDDINVSLAVEKELDGRQVPVPLLIEKSHQRSIESITEQILEARNKTFSDQDIVLHNRSSRNERLYYHLPGFLRRYFWRYLLKHPQVAFSKMGNVAITSIGMMGNVNGWFIPFSVHPVCFGIGRITRKPKVVDEDIVIREVLNMTVLLDHDVMDGAPMARFMSKLTENVEKGEGL